jgi:hypothetical protein
MDSKSYLSVILLSCTLYVSSFAVFAKAKEMSEGELEVRAVSAYAGISHEQYLKLNRFRVADSYALKDMGIIDLNEQPAILKVRELVKNDIDIPRALEEETWQLMHQANAQLASYSGISREKLTEVMINLAQAERVMVLKDRLRLKSTDGENLSPVFTQNDAVEVIEVEYVVDEDSLEESTSGGDLSLVSRVQSEFNGGGIVFVTQVRVIYKSSQSGSYLGSQSWVARSGWAEPTGNLYFNGEDASLNPF